MLDSHIGYGSPTSRARRAHGEPLGEEEVRLTKRAYGWPEDAKFLVPDGVYEHFADGIGAARGASATEWTELFAAYRAKYPELADEIDRCSGASCPLGGIATFPSSLPMPKASPDAKPRAKC